MTESEKKAKFLWYTVAAVLMSAAFLFSFFGISRSLWFDECCSIEIANTNFGGILSNLEHNAHTPPLYYFLLSLWMKFFGTGEAAARSLSALFYLFSIPALYALGKTLFDRRTAFLCSFLFLVNPMAVQFAQFARMYSFLSLLAILSSLFFFRIFFKQGGLKKDWAAYLLINMAGTFTHYWFFFLLLAQASAWLFLFSKSSFKKFAAAMAASVLPFFLLWTPTLLAQMTNGGTSEITRPGPYVLINTLLIYFGEGKKAVLIWAAILALGLLDIQRFRPRLQSFFRWKEFFRQRETLALLVLFLVSLGTPWLVSQYKPMYIETKYPMMVLFTVVMLAGAFLARFGNRHLVAAFCMVWFLAVTAGLIVRRTHPPVVSSRSITDYLLQHAGNQDILLLATSSRMPMDYYLRRAGRRFAEFSFPAEQALHPCWPNLEAWRNSKPALEAEADALLKRVDSLMETGGGRVWFFKGHLTEIDGILKGRLDAYFKLVEEKTLDEGYRLFGAKIQIYEKRTPPRTGR